MYAMTRIASDHYCHLAGDEALQDCPNPKSLTAMSCWFGSKCNLLSLET